MLDNEIHDGNGYEKLPYIDVRELGKDFGDFYKEIDDWDEFESKLLDELIDNPRWLQEKEPELIGEALDRLKETAGSGKQLKERLIGIDENIVSGLFLRAIGIFSEREGYKYLWSAEHYKKGGPLTGTFDISLNEANAHYSSGLSRKREHPCLVRLSIDSLIKKYRASGKHEMVIIFEHGAEGLFESIEIASDVDRLDIKVFKGIREKEEGEKKLINPTNNQVAMQIIQVDENTMEIEWARGDLMRTRFSAVGPEAKMYEYIKKEIPKSKEFCWSWVFNRYR